MSRVREAATTQTRVWILAMITACIAAVMWASVAQAQSVPFDSQYAPPPTAPPTSESVPPTDPAATPSPEEAEEATPAEDAVVSEGDDGEPVVDLLPTTGGTGLAPILLGGAVVSAAAIVTVRRKRD